MKKPDSVTPEEFIQVWQTSASGKEVAQKTNSTIDAVCSRAGYYRRQGVNLKKMKRGAAMTQNWDELAKLAEAYEEPD